MEERVSEQASSSGAWSHCILFHFPIPLGFWTCIPVPSGFFFFFSQAAGARIQTAADHVGSSSLNQHAVGWPEVLTLSS